MNFYNCLIKIIIFLWPIDRIWDFIFVNDWRNSRFHSTIIQQNLRFNSVNVWRNSRFFRMHLTELDILFGDRLMKFAVLIYYFFTKSTIIFYNGLKQFAIYFSLKWLTKFSNFIPRSLEELYLAIVWWNSSFYFRDRLMKFAILFCDCLMIFGIVFRNILLK